MLIPPIVGMFGSFLPLWFEVRWLGRALGIPDNVPVKDQPLGWVWIVAFLIGNQLHLWAGFALGWVMNIWVLRSVLGWRWSMVGEVVDLPIARAWIAAAADRDGEGPAGGGREHPLFDAGLDEHGWALDPEDDAERNDRPTSASGRDTANRTRHRRSKGITPTEPDILQIFVSFRHRPSSGGTLPRESC